MSVSTEARKPLRMVTCGGCGAKVFIPGELAPLSTVPCTKCSFPLMMPLRLRQFELLMPIASGGMGTVYRAFDTTLQREVAIKLMKRGVAEDPKGLDNFVQEARACASLNHTNIIHVYAFDESDGERYLVMELADCGSLDNRIEREQRLPELDVLDIGTQVASALAAALKRNIIHRDIKPGNILFNAEGEPKLIDFGLARKVEADLQEEAVWGTPYYIAPEKIKREREDFLSDLYSLAGTLYHALTGHVPFEAPSIDEVIAAHIHTPLTPPHLVVPEVTLPTSEALVRAMAKQPAERFQTYDELIMALTAARSQLLVSQLRNQGRGDGSTARSAAPRSWWRRS
ncbi:MAG: serine/threonine-protein kinase [Verrucomicrobiota bacterium]